MPQPLKLSWRKACFRPSTPLRMPDASACSACSRQAQRCEVESLASTGTSARSPSETAPMRFCPVQIPVSHARRRCTLRSGPVSSPAPQRLLQAASPLGADCCPAAHRN
eukprot:197749-Rhodomonas_salina.3